MLPNLSRMLLVSAMSAALVPCAAPSLPAEGEDPGNEAEEAERVDPSVLFEAVRGYAAAMIDSATDKFGDREGSLLLSLLDRRTIAPPAELPSAPSSVPPERRVRPYGSNLLHDGELYLLLYRITVLSGDPNYLRTARRGIQDAAACTQNPTTGMLGWGGRIYYDARADRVVAGSGDEMVHELTRPWPLFDRAFDACPDLMVKYAKGLWRWGVADEKGDFRPQQPWDDRKPEGGQDSPGIAGVMIHVWAEAFRKSKDDQFLRHIDAMLKRYEGAIHPRTHLLPSRAGAPECDLMQQTLLALELEVGRKSVPEEFAKRMGALAARCDLGVLALEHDASGRGLILRPRVDTGKGDRVADLWVEGDGSSFVLPTIAGLGELWARRWRQLEAGSSKECLGKLIVACADRYRGARLPTDIDLWALAPAEVIGLELGAHAVTGEETYLASAERFAADAIAAFWGDRSLPRASTRTDHYETVTGADDLGLAILEVYATLSPPAEDGG